jgi:hypothetical protein
MCLSSKFSSWADCQHRFWTQRFLYILLQMRGYAIVDFLPILQLGIAPVVLDSDSCNFRVTFGVIRQFAPSFAEVVPSTTDICLLLIPALNNNKLHANER